MAWLGTNKDGQEVITDSKPKRVNGDWTEEVYCEFGYEEFNVYIPKGTIEKLIGKTLTWEDEPVEFE